MKLKYLIPSKPVYSARRGHKSSLLIAVFFASILATGACISRAAGVPGISVQPPRPIPEYILLDHLGQRAVFPSANNKYKLVFFGYTSCPDVCPVGMRTLSGVLKKLGRAANRFEVLFISIDSLRDKPRLLKDYVNNHNPDITGLTGEPAEITKLQNTFGITSRKIRGETALAYTLDHSAFIYLLDPQGRLRHMYPVSESTDALAAHLRGLMEADSPGS